MARTGHDGSPRDSEPLQQAAASASDDDDSSRIRVSYMAPTSSAAKLVTAREVSSSRVSSRWMGTWTVALAGGFLLGALGWVAREYFSGGAAMLGDSAALWLALSWFVGSRESRAWRGAAMGWVALVATVTGYYLALLLVAHRGDYPATVVFWYAAALVGGPAFGFFGWLSRTGSSVLRAFSAAALGGAFIAEATSYATFGVYPRVMLALEVVVGLVLAGCLVRSWRGLASSAACLVALLFAGVTGWRIVATLYQRFAG